MQEKFAIILASNGGNKMQKEIRSSASVFFYCNLLDAVFSAFGICNCIAKCPLLSRIFDIAF